MRVMENTYTLKNFQTGGCACPFLKNGGMLDFRYVQVHFCVYGPTHLTVAQDND